MRRRLPLFTALAAAALALTSSGAAGAFERQWHVGAGFGYALYGNAAGAAHGFGGDLHATYGLTDTWNAMAQLDLVRHPSGQLTVAGGSLGIGYVVDVLRWVPYVGATVGAYDQWTSAAVCGAAAGADCHAPRLGLGIPGGLDYQLSRSFAVGVQARYELLLVGAPAAHLFTTFARFEYVWGF